MNYKKHYNLLIERAKNRKTIDGYSEKHHILPRCMGGNDLPENIVPLTAREHYIAHQLLAKMYPNNPGLINAVFYMTVNSPDHKRSNNRLYEWVRKKYSKSKSISQTGSGNSQFGTKWITNGIDNKKVRVGDLQEELVGDWRLGRTSKLKGQNNGNWIGYVYTPYGKFDSLQAAADAEPNKITQSGINGRILRKVPGYYRK